MPLPKHLAEAATRLEEASARIDAARASTPTIDSLAAWLAALTDQVQALADVQRYDDESIHEKLHALAGRLKLDDVL